LSRPLSCLKLIAVAAEGRVVLPQILAILVQLTPIVLNACSVTLDSPEVAPSHARSQSLRTPLR